MPLDQSLKRTHIPCVRFRFVYKSPGKDSEKMWTNPFSVTLAGIIPKPSKLFQACFPELFTRYKVLFLYENMHLSTETGRT